MIENTLRTGESLSYAHLEQLHEQFADRQPPYQYVVSEFVQDETEDGDPFIAKIPAGGLLMPTFCSFPTHYLICMSPKTARLLADELDKCDGMKFDARILRQLAERADNARKLEKHSGNH